MSETFEVEIKGSMEIVSNYCLEDQARGCIDASHEKMLVCKGCENEIINCDNCNNKFQEGEIIECFKTVHYCEKCEKGTIGAHISLY